ncbi:MAG: U32 family peptidase [Desulfobulbaceae bacterium]|nr:U32 family peptidase [Desulfobulbaceae bacterium]
MNEPAMELLAPVGSLSAFEAACSEGADAVYIGAPAFNARALSRDFSFAEIGAMIEHMHGSGKKLYIAMNILVKEEEMRQAMEALSIFSRLQPDALIIQDIGLLYLARRFFPDLPLHASTLMSVHNSLGADQLTDMGFERVVLARELTIDEMESIARASGAELEVFIHGAMCFSYSGLCLFSSLHGGKSSLRGQCVQPCRRRYSWESGKKGGRGAGKKGKGGGYLFSMNDLCGIDFLPQLRQVGVASLKIEGRLKTVEYVRKSVRAYRLALDTIDSPEQERLGALDEAHSLLDEAMGRKRSTGYLLDSRPQHAVTPGISGNTGQMAGKVGRLDTRRGKDGRVKTELTVLLRKTVNVGDRLRLHDERSGERQSFSLKSLKIKGKPVQQGRVGQKVQILFAGGLKTLKRGVFHGLLFRVDVRSRKIGTKKGGRLSFAKTRKKPVYDRRLVERILDTLHWHPVRICKSPGTALKRYEFKGKKPRDSRRRPDIWIRLQSLKSLGHRFPVRPNRFLVVLSRENISEKNKRGAKLRKQQALIIWELPPIIAEKDLAWYQQAVEQLLQDGFCEFQLGHCSQVGLFDRKGDGHTTDRLRLYGGYTFNVLNSGALQAVHNLQMAGVQFSLETDRLTMASALGNFSVSMGKQGAKARQMKIGMYVYGRPPLFTARLDSSHFNYHRPFVSPRQEKFNLKHREGITRAYSSIPFSLLSHHNELQDMGVDYMVMDLSTGPLKKEIATLSTLLRGSGRLPNTLGGNFQGNLV